MIPNAWKLLAFMLTVSTPVHAGGPEPLTLRVNDAIALPGGTAAIVVRTYDARPISQGQICFRSRSAPTGRTSFSALSQTIILSAEGNATLSSSMTTTTDNRHIVVTDFESLTSSINATDGPLAVFYFAVDPNTEPGRQHKIKIDPRNTTILGPGGQPILLEPLQALLTIRNPGSKLKVMADGDKILPGEIAELSIQTFEPFASSAGRLVLQYDTSLFDGPPTAQFNPKHGSYQPAIDTSVPGRIVFDFLSPNNDFNTIPGNLVSVLLPSKASVPLGTTSALTLDAAASFMLDANGDPLPLKFKPGKIRFRD